MAFHRVAVNIDGDRACANRVAFAAGIARRFGGELVGVYARLPNPAAATSVWPALPNNEMMDRLRETHSAEIDAHIGRLRPSSRKPPAMCRRTGSRPPATAPRP